MGKHLTQALIDEVIQSIEPYMDKDKTLRQVSRLSGIEQNLITRVVKKCELTNRFVIGNEARRLNAQDTWVEKYGSMEKYKEHLKSAIEQGMIEKYGVPHNSMIHATVQKRSATMRNKTEKEKEQILNRKNESLAKKYGSVEEFWTHQREQSLKTKEERYGNRNFTNPEKTKKTVKERYGVDNVFQYDSIKQKTKETLMRKYGVEFYSKTAEYHNKVATTNMRKYGVPSYLSSEDCKEKSMKTFNERYGVDWYVLTPECIESRRIKNDSEPNKYFAQMLDSNQIEYTREFRIKNFIYDFKVDNTLIEINPFPTHNIDWGLFTDTGIDKDYHLDKTRVANSNGYNVIHIWDWDDQDKIIRLVDKRRVRIGARGCQIEEIGTNVANEFLDKNHLQHSCRGNSVNIALKHDDIVVSVMTFGKPRYNNNYEWELLRFCNNLNYVVMGATNKLFNYFVRKYNPKSVISYCDRSKFSGKVYKNLGFSLLRSLAPSVHWTDGKIHITDNLLRQRGFDQLFNTDFGKGTSNEELMLQHKFVRVPDCGQDSYIKVFVKKGCEN